MGVENSVSDIRRGSVMIAELSDRGRVAAEANARIVSSSGAVAETAKESSAASEQQVAVSTKVTVGIDDVGKVSRQVLDDARGVSVEAGKLPQLAEELRTIAGQFRT